MWSNSAGIPGAAPRLALAASLAIVGACNSDLRLDESSATSTTGDDTTTTGDVTTTTGDDTTTTTTGETTTTGDPPPSQTCRDVLDCITQCAISLDLQCFQMCTMNLPPEEGQKALGLGLCIGMQCFSGGYCTADDPTNMECIACIGLSLLSPQPPGCEDEAKACQ